jgi:hypothetical protein
MSDQYLQWIGVSLALIGWIGVRQLENLEAVSIGLCFWIISAILITIWGIRTGARGIALQNFVNLCFAVSALYPLMNGGIV